MKRRIITLLLALFASTSILFASSGKCGDNLTWDLTNSMLTISGTGNMTYYYYPDSAPWYSYRNSITSIVLLDGVTNIGMYAFCDCSNLISVAIPNTVTVIDVMAFSNCNNLPAITIPNSVTRISTDAFKGCSNLTIVTINSNTIASKTYTSSSNIKNIFGVQVQEYVIGEDVTSIGDFAFQGSSNLTSASISNNVTHIGKKAFSKCSSLNTIDIPNSVTDIGEQAFADCTNLVSAILPDNITSIASGLSAFCDNLTTIEIPNSVSTIGEQAFLDCTNLISISIGNSVTNIENRAFEGCGLTSITINADSLVNRIYTSTSSLQNIFGAQVQEYVLGEDIKGIGDFAFNKCSGLISITIPNTITSIGNSAFSGCKSLTSIELPNNLTNLGIFAFYGCSNLVSINIPQSLTMIESCTFSGCTSLASITIPNNITAITVDAFSGCSSIQSVEWNVINAASLGQYAYFSSAKDKITSFTFGEDVEIIPDYLCSNFSKITSITIPSSVTQIGYYAFENCSKLTSVVWNARNCQLLSYNYYHPFYNSWGIKTFTFGEDVESIPDHLCYGMYRLTSITIPNSVISIGKESFESCSGMTSLTIGNSVTSIENYAFYGCTGLNVVTCFATTHPHMGDDIFLGIDCSKIPLYVPAGSIGDYKAADQWKDFNPILQISGTSIEDIHIDSDKPVKVLHEGQVYILRGKKKYTLSGQEL